ncbi:MAG: putative heme transporter [Actinomycetota bacterium]|nr:putative heme transporter [Actinomycetota bacterium]
MTLARRVAHATASLGLVVVLLGFALPKVTGADWGPVLEHLELLTLWQVGLLLGLWLLGLYAHTFLTTAALPDLTHRQALQLNLSGSAVSNLLPFGGALGMGLNYAMVRSWGHGPGSFAPFTALTTLWNVLVKLALPVVALALLLAAGGLPTPGLALAAVLASATLLTVLLLVMLALASQTVAGLLGRATQSVACAALRLVRSSRTVSCEQAVLDLRQRMTGLLRRRWHHMLLGMATYAVLQATLLWLILSMLGSSLGIVYVFAGFSFGRLLTLLVVTPGGVGIAETGSAALLVALGGDAAVVAAGTLLFSAITFALEIPVGGVCGLLWWRTRRVAL